MEDKRVREIAILRYEKGEPPKKIYTDLGKSKSWFFKWLKRYKLEGGLDQHQDQEDQGQAQAR